MYIYILLIEFSYIYKYIRAPSTAAGSAAAANGLTATVI